ncbi:DNA/RNA non-specific endonuclease [Okeania sp. SIO1I7]|uniref:DNA/RNA non-specific endonuclease n=1 Tax=Okeania sp. SIO1I7 TaxID=2607772 RepID=UPI0025DFF877|nr:DNA/RNA non-specific endonuclease [Okeania sp. SIO1I7]
MLGGAGLTGLGVSSLATVPVLINAAEKSVTAITIPQVGLPYETESGVQLNPGQFCCGSLTVDLPTPPAPDALALTKVEVKVPPPSDDSSNQVAGRVIFLEGENFGNNLDELEVNFHLGDKAYPGTILPELSNLAEGKIAVVSDYVPYGEASVSVEKTITSIIGTETIVETETIQLPVEERVELAMTTMTFGNRVNLINARNPLEVIASDESSSQDLLLASIPVGSRPRYTAATSEASRAYVTLEGGSGLAVLDLQGFRQLDTQPDVEGVNPIALPDDSSPRPLIIDPLDNYAYVGDGQKGQIYVIDINPNSPDYNQHVETIDVGDAPSGLKKLAISSDGKRLFATTPNGGTSNVGQILVVNIDPDDRPVGGSDNVRKWHQQIGAIDGGRGTEGITATSDELKMAFTNRSDEPKGYGVLTIVNNDPLNFEATTTYAPMSLGPFDSFDVNEAVDVEVIYDEVTGTDYAFVAGFNMRNFTLNFGSFDGKSNVGIIKDALGDNPQLVAGTQRIPFGNTSDLALSSDNRFLFAAYPGIESTFAFDVREMISTINDPTKQAQLETQAIDVVNPNVSVAADLQVVSTNPITREVEWRVPDGSERGPISTGTLPWGVEMASKGTLISLEEPDGEDLTPTLKWEIFRPGSKSSEDDDCDSCLLAPAKEEDIESVKLYMSVFPKGEGLLPGDDWDELKDKPETDLNPQRVLTAEWNQGYWIWGNNLIEGSMNEFTLPDERMLTGGQTYHWAVEVEWSDEVKNSPDTGSTVTGEFETNLPEIKDGSNQFSSVTVLTQGVMSPESKSFTQQTVDAMAEQMEDAGAAVMRYSPTSGKWNSVTYNDSINGWTATPVSPVEGKPLVLLADWMNGLGTDNGSFRSAGVAEAAADGLFSSLVDLDFKYGGTVGGDSLYDENGDLIRSHGAVFNSPLHFVGFGQGAVVNTEIVQRLGTYFPTAGGFDAENRDLHFTTVDPFEYNPETVSGDFEAYGRMLDPEIVIWDNVTYADNYYQQQAPEGDEKVIRGKPLTEADNNQEFGSWAGFDSAKASDNPHHAAVSWYGGTANLNESQIPQGEQQVFRRFGDLLAKNLSSDESWFVPGHINANFPHGDENAPWEGIGTGWFYSVNGGGKDLRPGGDDLRPYFVDGVKKSRDDLGDFKTYLKENRRSVSYDNTYTNDETQVGTRMRGDSSVSSLFNGNFDVIAGKFSAQAESKIPGWFVENDSGNQPLQKNLVPWHNINTFKKDGNDYLNRIGYNETQPNYALFLRTSQAKEVVHNNFVVPEWGDLRFNLLAPIEKGKLKVMIETPPSGIGETDWQSTTLETIDLSEGASGKLNQYKQDIYKIGFGREGGFETFHVPIDDRYRGKTARLRFKLESSNPAGVFLDDVFFSSANLKFGNPSEARFDSRVPGDNPYRENLLIEKPQYAVSYNRTTKTPNWVSWQVNPSWTGGKRAGKDFIADPTLPQGWPQISGKDYEGQNPTTKKSFSLGFDKGHTIPSRDRTRHNKDNIATFLGTNLFPQSIDNNRFFYDKDEAHDSSRASAWRNIEHMVTNLTGYSKKDKNIEGQQPKEVYVVAGSLGTDWKSQNPRSNALEDERKKGATQSEVFQQRKINIPKVTWKSLLVLDNPGLGVADVTKDTKTYTFLTPNIPEPHQSKNWEPVDHPFDTMKIGNETISQRLQLENAGNLGQIETIADWRDPETWQVTIQELENLLTSANINLFSNLPKNVKDDIKDKKYDLPT